MWGRTWHTKHSCPQLHLLGVTAGDIGPKMGFEHSDNGFLRLDHVRVPRENMLSRFAQVRVWGVSALHCPESGLRPARGPPPQS